MKSGLTISFGLISVLGSVAALPQAQASVTLWEFGPTTAVVVGTEWAQPIGTASDGSVTTFILENVVSGILSSSIITTETAIQTVMVSASGWAQTGVASGTVLAGGIDCSFTDSISGECVEEEVLDDGSTSTQTLTGSAFPFTLAISTGTLPSGAGVTTTAVSQSTVSTNSGITVSVTETVASSPTSTSTSAASPATSSNAASSMHMSLKGCWNMGALAVVGGMVLGASTLLL